MALIDILADVSGLRRSIDDNTQELRLIREAFERLSPPIPLPREEDAGHASERRQASEEDNVFHVAESPEEYEERISEEAALAISLGVAPWSPAFEKVIFEMRQDLMKPRMEPDTDGNLVRKEGLTKAEAEDHIREAFKLARAEASNLR